MSQTNQQLDEALQHAKNAMANGNDSSHYSCFYEPQNIASGELCLSIFSSFKYDKNGKVENINEILDKRRMDFKDFQLFMLLKLILQRINEFGISHLIQEMAQKLLQWFKKDLVINISDWADEPNQVSCYPSDPKSKTLNPVEEGFVSHFLALYYTLTLFNLFDAAKVISENGESSQHFMVMLFSSNYFLDKLIQS